MVCSIRSGKMTALVRLLDAGSISRTAIEEVRYQNLAALSIGRDLRDADEANLIDEEDMDIFGLRPMTDPLDLVCCNACKKPIKTSQYASHAELCKYLSSIAQVYQELDGPPVTKKPPRKERKKSQITRTKKGTSLRESKKIESGVSCDIAAPVSRMDENIQMTPFTEARRETHPGSTQNRYGSAVNPYNVDCLKDVTKRSSKPLKRTAAENLSNQGTKNFCKTSREVLQYVPAPLATKIYYSQRNNHLRRAISRMFFEEPARELSNEVPSSEDLQVNTFPDQTSTPGNFFHEQVAIQQRDDRYLHLAQTPDQVYSSMSNFCTDDSGAFEPPMISATPPPVNNTLGSHYISNSYSFADKSENPLGSLQQDSGSVPVV